MSLVPRFTLFIAILCFSGQVQSVETIAQVFRVFGKVTQLRPGDLIARKVVQGDKVPVDTSIVTGNKSFVQIVYLNGGNVNIGPNSKVIIRSNIKKKQGVIGLLKGKIRSSYEDPSVRKSKDLKFFVTTKTAAMGVRGTEFQTIYNPKNSVTNLLTFKGDVSMVKVDNDNNESKKKKKRRKRRKKVTRNIKRNAIDDIEVDIEVNDELVSENNIENLILNGEEDEVAVSVKSGQYSGSLPGLDRATIPVKVSPIQLATLNNNSAINVKDPSDQLKPVDIAVEPKVAVFQADQLAPPEGMYDATTGEYAPKAGGFIDLQTGLYIQPSSRAFYNEKLGLYLEKDFGTIDSETGQYIPPKGLIIHPTKGFVPASVKDKKNKRLLLAASYLNKEIQKDIYFSRDQKSKTKLIENNYLSEQELFSKNLLTLTYLTGSQTLSVSNDSILGDGEYESNSRSGYRILWEIASNSTWRPYTYLEKQSVSMEVSNSSIDKVSEDVMELAAGINYFKSSRTQFFGQIGFDQNIALLHPSSESDFDRLSRLKIKTGVRYLFVKSKRYHLGGKLHFSLLPSTEQETLAMNTSFAYGFDLFANYWINRTLRLNLLFENETMSMNLAYPAIEYDQDLSQRTTSLSLTKVF